MQPPDDIEYSWEEKRTILRLPADMADEDVGEAWEERRVQLFTEQWEAWNTVREEYDCAWDGWFATTGPGWAR